MGRNQDKRVEVYVNGFLPYFFVETNKETIWEIFQTAEKYIRNWVIETEEVKKYLFFGGTIKNITKITGNEPFFIPRIRAMFQKKGIIVHEADIPFVMRFLIDQNLRALHWIEAKGTIILEEPDLLILRTSYKDLLVLPNYQRTYQPMILAFDIEVNEQGETLQELINEKKQRITAISIAWGTIETENPQSTAFILKKDTDEAEVNLLTEFIEFVTQTVNPDIFVSFNGTLFDIPYLQSRMVKYGKILGSLTLFKDLKYEAIKSNNQVTNYRLKGRGIIDLLPKTWGIHHISGKKTLNTITELILGESKVQIEKSPGEMWRSSVKGNEKDRETFFNYSLKDAILTFRLCFKLGLLDDIELCRLSGYPLPEGILSTSRNIGELELMRILYSKNLLIPSKPSLTELKRRNELKKRHPHLGGWVLEPTVSEATSVAIFDFRSLYPNIVRQHNMSGETLIFQSEHKLPEERFKKDQRGALAELMDIILERRYRIIEEIRSNLNQKTQKQIEMLEKRQQALKLMANSLLGATNYTQGRFYHHLISNSITSVARALLSEKLNNWTVEFSKTQPSYNVYLQYGDTDSIFVQFDLNLDSIHNMQGTSQIKRNYDTTELLTAIDAYSSFLASHLPEFLELKLEDIASRIILKKGRKKAYAYHSFMTNRVIIKGFEAIRSDWSPLAKKTQRKMLETLLTDNSTERESKARKIVFDACQFIQKKSVNILMEYLTIRGPLKRSPKKYRSKTPAIGAFLNYCKANNLSPEETWSNWDGFPYIIAKGSQNQPQYQRAYHPEVFLSGKREIDRRHYIREILGASNRFDIKISEDEAVKGIFIVPLTLFFNQ